MKIFKKEVTKYKRINIEIKKTKAKTFYLNIRLSTSSLSS
jgi:hypothetical protein